MASEELLSGAVSYQIQDDLVGELRVDEALAWYRSDSYVNPDSDGPSFQVVDEAHIIQGSIVEPDARTVMGGTWSGLTAAQYRGSIEFTPGSVVLRCGSE